MQMTWYQEFSGIEKSKLVIGAKESVWKANNGQTPIKGHWFSTEPAGTKSNIYDALQWVL